MKKLTKIFALVVVCALAVTALVACGSDPVPNTDYDEAKANLKKNGYSVTAVKSGDEGSESLIESVITSQNIKAEDFEAYISAKADKTADLISMYWFKNAEAANKYYEDCKKNMEAGKEELKKELENMKKQIDAMAAGAEKDQAQAIYDAAKEAYDATVKAIDEMIIGKSGNVVYAGTKAAIEATK
ncbi:MAG: hypothetical protein NC132_05410 [Corallococcus sp.]|nr:hypothetical protein [Corallococcus sp.]MCM1359975.1 hypothetical protein [Corallococcus sp.]MCM1395532.1 hypothetical protein [Corallococcus sp.]